MLVLLALFVATAFGNVYETLQAAIANPGAAQSLPMLIGQAVMSGDITILQAADLMAQMQEAVAAAAAAAAGLDCSAQESDDRYQTPVNDGIVGYGTTMCASLPAAKFTNPTVSASVPDLSGIYTMVNGMCPAILAGGNQIQIEQDGEDIIFTGSRVVHHFMKEADGCEAVLSDIKAGCAGLPVAQLAAPCQTGQVTAVPRLDDDCWDLVAPFVTVSWCKTATGVSRAINGNVVHTFTTV